VTDTRDQPVRPRLFGGTVVGALVSLFLVSILMFPFTLAIFIIGLPIALFIGIGFVWPLIHSLHGRGTLSPRRVIIIGGSAVALFLLLGSIGTIFTSLTGVRMDGTQDLTIGTRVLIQKGQFTQAGWLALFRDLFFNFGAGSIGAAVGWEFAFRDVPKLAKSEASE
jgi:hypothetical protein